jgi:hypothetical protein
MVIILYYSGDYMMEYEIDGACSTHREDDKCIQILVLRFSRLEFNVQLRLSGVSRVECRVSTNVSANITVAIFKVNV